MTAVLSPAEAEETTRFGIFDGERSDAWRDIVEHADEVLLCTSCGTAAAEWRVRTRCCAGWWFRCTRCLVKERGAWLAMLAAVRSPNPRSFVVCTRCHKRWVPAPPWGDVFEARPL